MNPREKDPTSPINPIPAGIAPDPKRELMGIVSDTDTFLMFGEPILERAAKPAGKKECENIGCRNMMSMIHDPGTIPSNAVTKPVVKKTAFKVFFTPKRSVTHPERRTITGVETLERANKVLAQVRSIPRSETK